MMSTWGNVLARRQLLGTLVMNELKMESQEGRFGWAFWLVDPALTLASYWLIKSLFLGRDKYVPYTIFAGCAVFAWRHFGASVRDASRALRRGNDLIRSAAFPSVILPWAAVLVQSVYFAGGIAILILAAGALGRPLTATLLQIPVLMVLQLALVTGIATAVACASVFRRRFEKQVSTLLRFAWFVSPGMYGLDLVLRFLRPEVSSSRHALWELYMLNPFAILFVGYRAALFDPVWLAGQHWLVLVLESVSALWVGHTLYQRYERRLVKLL